MKAAKNLSRSKAILCSIFLVCPRRDKVVLSVDSGSKREEMAARPSSGAQGGSTGAGSCSRNMELEVFPVFPREFASSGGQFPTFLPSSSSFCRLVTAFSSLGYWRRGGRIKRRPPRRPPRTKRRKWERKGKMYRYRQEANSGCRGGTGEIFA